MERMEKIRTGVTVLALLVSLFSACASSPSVTPSAGAALGNNTVTGVEGQGASTAAEPVELSLLVNMDWFFMDNWGGRPVDDLITEKTGIKFNVTRVADDQQLPVLMASNQLPDMVYTDDKLQELSNENQCYELGGLIKQYAPNMPLPSEQVGISTLDDGRFYYLVNFWKTDKDWQDPHFMPGVGTSGLIYRADILAQTGLAEPKTMDELEAVLKKVKELHPDMVPLALYSEGGRYSFMINQNMLENKNYNLAEVDGEWVYFAGTDAYKSGMRTLNRFAQQGLLVPQMFTLKYEQYIQETQSGNVFMWIDDSSNLDINNQAYAAQNIEGANAVFLKNILYPGASYPFVDRSSGWAGTFITKNCKNVEAAVKFLEWMSTDEAGKLVGWGVEGEHYTLDDNGYPILATEIAKSWAEDYDATVRNTGVGAWFFGTNAWYESVRTYAPEENPSMTDYLLFAKSVIQMRPECATLYPPPGSDESAILAALNSTENTYYSRIIFAKDDAEFDKMIAEFDSQLAAQGMPHYNEWAKAKWAKIKELYGIK